MPGRKVWTEETLAVPDLQGFLQDQTVMRFASAAARTAAIPIPTEGMVTTLDDTNTVERYDPANGWQDVGGRTWPLAQLRQTTQQGGGVSGTYYDLLMQAEDYDSHNAHAPNAAPWICPAGQGGTYAVEGVVVLVGPGTAASAFARLTKNGAFIPASYGPGGTYAGGSSLHAGTGRVLVSMVPGDYVALQATATYATWATQVVGDAASRLTVERVR